LKTLLITGINGFLGSLLAKRYTRDYRVIGLEYGVDNLFRLKDESFEVYDSQDGNYDALFFKHKVDCVIHTATFYGREQESDSKMMFANTYLPQILLEKLVKHGCAFFINTDTVLDRYTNSYALTKRQFRDWLQFYAESGMMKVANLQLEHFYGPGTASTNFITLMTQKMLQNEEVIALTKAEQNRDFLFIDDLVQVYDICLKNERKFSNYENFNVGAGINTNLKYILEFIKKNTGSSSELNYGAIPYRPNELMESKNNITKLTTLGWKSQTSIDEGLLKVISYEKKHL
jgi:CDP-paratose synthetase